MEAHRKLRWVCCMPVSATICSAFLTARDGYSADVVLTDPPLNKSFIEACRAAGLDEAEVYLNSQLLALRKSGKLEGHPTTKRAKVRSQEEYRFASEIAIRFLERERQVSLDLVLCDTSLALAFDEVAARIAPGFTPFEYRWAALGLRKNRKLQPELLSRVVVPEAVFSMKVKDLVVDEVPLRAGLYLFYDASESLYIGEAENLRKRIKKHLEHSDNKGLARWLWGHGAEQLHVEFHVLPEGIAARSRKALELELIRSRHPVFNVSGSAP